MVERAQKERLGRRICQVGAIMFVLLLANGLFEMWFSYQEHKASLIRIQREQADAAAAKITRFINEIVSQVGWTTQLPLSTGTLEQRRFDALRLLRQVPAVTEIVELDSTGYEELRIGRLGMNDGVYRPYPYQKEFAEAVAGKVYYGPVYFRLEPYMTLALAGTARNAGVSVAEVNLKFIWEMVSQIKVGQRGDAYVVDREGRLIAHPDISLVLRNTDMSQLAQVQAARQATADAPAADAVQDARDIAGREVLTAYAPIAPLGWLVFVELPVQEAYAPLYFAMERLFVLLAVLTLAFFGVAWFSSRARRVSRKMAAASEVIE
jgi:hypothetical protein